MEFNKCNRCGCFFMSNNDVCPSCQPKDIYEMSKLKNYFENENCMFVGDFLFAGTIGRCDLETGNIEEMKKSLMKIKKYPNVDIYPGHGDSTTLNHELKNNIYLNYIEYF